MPSVELNALQSAVAAAHGDVNARIVRDSQRFQRYVNKRMARIQREGQANQGKLLRALSDSLGFDVPQNATIDARPDGTAVLSWLGADPRDAKKPAESASGSPPPKAPDAPDGKILALNAEAPKNGAHEHAVAD